MRRFLMHSFFWLGFYFMWNQIMYFYISDTGNRLYFSALDVSLIICAFYGVYAWLMPSYFKHKQLLRLLVQSFIWLGLLAGGYAFIMKIFLTHMLVPIHFDFSWNYTDLQYNRFFIALVGILGGAFLKLALDRINTQRKLDAMEKANSLAELTYLKAQLNPHFLFNSLNSLYTQLDFDVPQAKVTLISIADLLRYQLYECNSDYIPLSKEFIYLENYFNLQRIRTDATASLNIIAMNQDLKIAPLLLMPFIENAFKYVSDDDNRENIIQIDIQLTDDQLHFYCMNSTARKQPTNNRHGVGLQNVRQRLELMYPHQHQLEISENDNSFSVHLNLTLQRC
ncbi:sensor histidine kinase [Chitinophaga sp. Cy-1792]|uniref:sensor histidine kinase n=1 Tax=Chitinophaga sp. Cy-1792 TaxID=2608339 RepID=UPI00141E4FD7|nr:sensor histidine kinase [Chitinophaga sp. Cy-1792]NIG52856.1 GHKL domain-containing protein [Chitinophaga sp. Cy-1792]